MAKTKLINETEMSFDINLNSRDYNYKYTTTEKTQVSFIVKDIENYERAVYLIKDGQNLKFIAIYCDITGKTKKIITNTLLDYYIHSQKYEGDQVLSNIGIYKTYTQVSGKTIISTNGNNYAGSNNNDIFFISNTANYIVDLNGNDTYKIEPFYNYNTHNTIYDYAGNDKYVLTTVKDFSIVNISDYMGNDFYNFTGSSYSSISDHKGNDIYNFYGSAGNRVSDYAGNDMYNVNYSSSIDITDKGGNDKYNVNNSRVMIYEKNKGNDTYNLNGLYDESMINDYVGNDKYIINYANGTNEGKVEIDEQLGNDTYSISGSKYIKLTEYDGNDKYTIKNSENLTITDKIANSSSADKDSYNLTSVKNSTITDESGKDTYKINYSESVTVVENGGVDNYTVMGSNKITITDSSSDTKESYTIKSSSETTITSSSGDDKFVISDDSTKTVITDCAGNEKYTVKNADYLKITDTVGNDNYNFVSVDNLNSVVASEYGITDNDGNDTYTIKDSSFVYLSDKTTSENLDKDTYNITNSQDIKITDMANSLFSAGKFEKNVYNIIKTKNFSINVNEENADYASIDIYNLKTSSGEIKDYDDTDDIYNITSSNVNISDKSNTSNDTYKIDKLSGSVYVNDAGGNKDFLTISGNKDNLIFMASDGYYDNGERKVDKALYIYDKGNKGFISIDNFFDMYKEGSSVYFESFGTGAIETIKIGKNEYTEIYDYYRLGSIMQGVATWIQNKGYTNIASVLESQDKALINELVLKFTP